MATLHNTNDEIININRRVTLELILVKNIQFVCDTSAKNKSYIDMATLHNTNDEIITNYMLFSLLSVSF